MGRRGEANSSNIFLGIFLHLKCDTLKQMELYNTAAYPYLTLMVLLLGNWLVMENSYFQYQGKLILLADCHYEPSHASNSKIFKTEPNTFHSQLNIDQLQIY